MAGVPCQLINHELIDIVPALTLLILIDLGASVHTVLT